MAKHILIVDDSKTVRNLVAFILKKEGFKVTTAEDGLDGLEKLYGADQPVDLIVSDVNMPRMDGLSFIKTIREQEAYRDMPIVVLSTEGQDKDIKTGLNVGANLYMVKPAQPEKLLRNVKMLLG
jgi:two-component system chemotaxis response regulator CheY